MHSECSLNAWLSVCNTSHLERTVSCDVGISTSYTEQTLIISFITGPPTHSVGGPD